MPEEVAMISAHFKVTKSTDWDRYPDSKPNRISSSSSINTYDNTNNVFGRSGRP